MNWAIIGGTVGVICGTLLVAFNKRKVKKENTDNLVLRIKRRANADKNK